VRGALPEAGCRLDPSAQRSLRPARV